MNTLQNTRLVGHINYTSTQAKGLAAKETKNTIFVNNKSVTNVTSHENITCC